MIKNFLLNLLFPSFCLNCGQEGSYLCEDCRAALEISGENFCLCKNPVRLDRAGKCPRCQFKKLNGLYSALPYQNNLIQKLIQQFKYQPFIKELSKPLASLIINHFQLIEKPPNFFSSLLVPVPSSYNPTTLTPPPSASKSEFILIPIPLDKKKLKWRGFNQAEEIGKELSKFLKIPLMSNVLIKIKETLPQVELSGKEREENILGAFFVKNKELIKNKKILLVDDVYTTGSTLEESARILKEAGSKEVWGITITRD